MSNEDTKTSAARDARQKKWFISHLREGTINLGDKVKTEIVGTYQDAVDAAHGIWRSLKNNKQVTVHSDEYCLYFWHAIWASGKAEDRNTNSGVQFSNETL